MSVIYGLHLLTCTVVFQTRFLLLTLHINILLTYLPTWYDVCWL